MMSYSDFMDTCIFVVSLVGLCYAVFKGKK